MVHVVNKPCALRGGKPVLLGPWRRETESTGTMAESVLAAHGGERVKFDSLISHDITYVGILQTARAIGLTRFPVPYALTNCHNSLCAVGGTINEDDHRYGLSAAKKYGGIYVPANMAVIHQYARETLAGGGRMILGSDSHTRFGPFGCMGIGEGGGELVKQLLGVPYDMPDAPVVLVYLTGALRAGSGPMDAALALCAQVYSQGIARNKILEFAGPGVASLSMDERIALDVMTTETACLSSIWETDGLTREYLAKRGRGGDYREMCPREDARYDALIEIDLDTIEPMIALPFHPSNAVAIDQFLGNPSDYLKRVEEEALSLTDGQVALNLRGKLRDGGFWVDQGIIAGCAGGLASNLAAAAAIMSSGSIGDGAFSLSAYPASVQIALALDKSGVLARLTAEGVIVKPCFCGPCFGAGDVPAHGAFSIRHTTRNFPNREGSKPGDGQLSCVALMDARSIAMTARNGGRLTPATDIGETYPLDEEKALIRTADGEWDGRLYDRRVYNGWGRPQYDERLELGPNITDWPAMTPLGEHMLVEFAAVIMDDVTTTDELIPSGETSSYRSNPIRLADFTLSRRDPQYVPRAKAIQSIERERCGGVKSMTLLDTLRKVAERDPNYTAIDLLWSTNFGSALFARRPGDGSAREQAASCQRVLGGCVNLCESYATKRYKGNCINWGIVPFTLPEGVKISLEPGDRMFIPDVRASVLQGRETFAVLLIRRGNVGSAETISIKLEGLNERERQILAAGCLINFMSDNYVSEDDADEV
ncbi:MAG: hydratase [Oscillospiraceae bacterium]|jgi:aconitate hydratase|nr:hydratase [Oscillospiraceae bacterium]